MSLPAPGEPVYLDYAATTPPAAEVIETMDACLRDGWRSANPASIHRAGRAAAALEESARGQLAALLDAAPANLLWTSGATEANNLAILGAARFRAHRGRHVVTLRTEHKSVTDPCRALAREGFDVTWLTPGRDGVLSPDALAAALRDDTQLVSIMYVNNETGAMQDIAALGDICRARDVLFHSDAAQAAGKLPLDLARLPMDLLSLTAHKFYGPQGIGALYVADRPGCGVEPLLYGGGQQRGLRPGTLPVPLIAGCGKAAELARARGPADYAHAARLRARLMAGIGELPGLEVNGDPARSCPSILNVSIAGIEGESLLHALEPLCVASGSACNSQSGEPSAVLRAMGRSDALAQSAIRFSFGRGTTAAEVDAAVHRYRAAVAHLRRIAPAPAA